MSLTIIYCIMLRKKNQVNKVYAEQFNDVLPSRSAFQVAALPLGGNIEIEVIAGEK